METAVLNIARAAILAMLALAASVHAAPPGARLVMSNPEAFYPTPAAPDTRMLRVVDRSTGHDRMAILDDGTVTFNPGATVNFSGVHLRAGRLYGYVVVRVMGYPMLVPTYRLRDGERLPPEFDWGTEP